MIASVYIALGAGALAVSYWSLTRRLRPVEGAPMAAIMWALFALASFNVEPLTGGTPQAYDSLGILGGVLGAAMMLLFIQGLRGELADAAPQEAVAGVGGDAGGSDSRGRGSESSGPSTPFTRSDRDRGRESAGDRRQRNKP